MSWNRVTRYRGIVVAVIPGLFLEFRLVPSAVVAVLECVAARLAVRLNVKVCKYGDVAVLRDSQSVSVYHCAGAIVVVAALYSLQIRVILDAADRDTALCIYARIRFDNRCSA